jgi:hypothetical protein
MLKDPQSACCTDHDIEQCLCMQEPIYPQNTIFVYWRNILAGMHKSDMEWLFDGVPIQRNLLKMVLHCLAHEIVHALLNACCSRKEKMSQAEGHGGAFKNLSGNIFGHPHMPGTGPYGGWCDITESLTLQGSFKKIPSLR